jgi:hypothetical protein
MFSTITSFVISLPITRQQASKIAAVKNDDVFQVHGGDEIIDVDLLPAPINFSRDSILFGRKPSTLKRNEALTLWKNIKTTFPKIVTGARTSTTADENPIGGMYNMIFVRIPVILAALTYGKNLVENHPLINLISPSA